MVENQNIYARILEPRQGRHLNSPACPTCFGGGRFSAGPESLRRSLPVPQRSCVERGEITTCPTICLGGQSREDGRGKDFLRFHRFEFEHYWRIISPRSH